MARGSDNAEVGFSIVAAGKGTFSADPGAGRFRSRVRCGETIMVGPGGASIQRDCAHASISYSFPYAELLAMVGDDAARHRTMILADCIARPLKDTLICTLLQRLWQEALNGNPSYATLQEGAITAIVALLLASRKEPSARAQYTALAAWQAIRAIAMMEDHVDRGLPLRELAAEGRLSPLHFARAVRSTTGLPPGRYHRMLRIERVKQRLVPTDWPMSEIARATGYPDPSYLARIFYRETGTGPGAYRRENRRR